MIVRRRVSTGRPWSTINESQPYDDDDDDQEVDPVLLSISLELNSFTCGGEGKVD